MNERVNIVISMDRKELEKLKNKFCVLSSTDWDWMIPDKVEFDMERIVSLGEEYGQIPLVFAALVTIHHAVGLKEQVQAEGGTGDSDKADSIRL